MNVRALDPTCMRRSLWKKGGWKGQDNVKEGVNSRRSRGDDAACGVGFPSLSRPTSDVRRGVGGRVSGWNTASARPARRVFLAGSLKRTRQPGVFLAVTSAGWDRLVTQQICEDPRGGS